VEAENSRVSDNALITRQIDQNALRLTIDPQAEFRY
jgi:hypothetical protein